MKRTVIMKLLPINCLVLFLVLTLTFLFNRSTVYVNQSVSVDHGKIIIIDAGHGHPDGGATSCTGTLEADLNLQISQRLNELMHFFGVHTLMTRESPESVYTKGGTIAQKKVSDIRNRVDMINRTPNGILISIHQNHFYESQYFGPQVFYKKDDVSVVLARHMQTALNERLAPDSDRKVKKASGVYLMEHVDCPGILVECGFLSNGREEALLRSDAYQKQLCGVIATACLSYLNSSS